MGTVELNRYIIGHCLDGLRSLPDSSVDCVVTSPPYWGLRDYGDPGQPWPEVRYSPLPGMPEIVIPEQIAALGQELDPYAFVGHLVAVFREVRRVLKPTGTMWLNLGDRYNGSNKGTQRGLNGTKLQRSIRALPQQGPPTTTRFARKALVGIPWLVAHALQADGYVLRSEVIWHKVCRPPDPVRDRPERAHEWIFLFAVSGKYDYHKDKSTDVWSLPIYPDLMQHDAAMNREVARRCIALGSEPGAVVLDPFMGGGTVAAWAERLGRSWIGCEQSEAYAEIGRQRLLKEREERGTLSADDAATATGPVQLGLLG